MTVGGGCRRRRLGVPWAYFVVRPAAPIGEVFGRGFCVRVIASLDADSVIEELLEDIDGLIDLTALSQPRAEIVTRV